MSCLSITFLTWSTTKIITIKKIKHSQNMKRLFTLLIISLVYNFTHAQNKILNGDLNHDGKLTAEDMTIMANMILEKNNQEEIVGDFEMKEYDPTPYLTFKADEVQTLTMSMAVETIEYSVNGGEWLELGSKTITFGGEYGDVRLRGKSAWGTTKITDKGMFESSTFSFNSKKSVSCSGDIRTLIDYENYSTTDCSQSRFRQLFWCCYSLTSAPDLPATTLADWCYYEMFGNCRSLTSAPGILPATSLVKRCYMEMFYGCSSLTTAPELPATQLADYCYSSMFYGCSSLTTAPELPATQLADYCYSSMFSGCSSLTIAPELPAMQLTDNCYYEMFGVCEALISAPQLPATTLAESCYQNMFSVCISLAAAPDLPAMTLADNCYKGMFSSCTALLTPPALPAATLANRCYENMFMGCSLLTTAPDLPATTLADGCYSCMFGLCTSLTTAPDLPATIFASDCYWGMFSDCSSLNKIKVWATSLEDNSFYGTVSYQWLWGVAPSGTFIMKEGANIPRGTSGVPESWNIEYF